MKKPIFGLLLLLLSTQLPAQIDLQLDLISDAFEEVVDITNAGDDRLFIVEKIGRIQILQANGEIAGTPFLDIDPKVGTGGERGLLSLAFHPSYSENGYFFVNYTDNDRNTVVARYQVSATNPALADPASETILLTIIQPFTNHNGGDLNFGPDGYLYIATGDGGDGGDPQNNSQTSTTPLGKVLRIDVDSGPGSGPDYDLGNAYTIPPSNPLADGPGGALDELWAQGLRNPWRVSFDRLTGDMWIGDVGQGQREEIDFEPANSPGGLNYGWRCYEANREYNTDDCGPANQYTFPVYEYFHDVGCSVTGGFVYRGEDYPLLYGLYLYTDYCSGKIWALQNEAGEWVNEELFEVPDGDFTTLGEDSRGELYLGSLNGEVYRVIENSCPGDLVLDDNPIPAATYQAGDTLTATGTVATGTSVTFQAGDAIVLEPGFMAPMGSTFQALIEGCTAPAASVAELPATVEPSRFPQALDLKVFPNPFRSETSIRYTLPDAAKVDILIYDLYGQLVDRPAAARQQDAGVYDLSFSAAGLPAGIYLVVLRADGLQRIGRMEIIR